jgi:hypothetical protein
MPYVTQEKRDRLDEDLLGSKTAGELGYVLGVICDTYLVNSGAESDTGAFRYQHICDVLGTLESIKLDLFREVIAPYEEGVQRDNGDVYGAPRQLEHSRVARDILKGHQADTGPRGAARGRTNQQEQA